MHAYICVRVCKNRLRWTSPSINWRKTFCVSECYLHLFFRLHLDWDSGTSPAVGWAWVLLLAKDSTVSLACTQLQWGFTWGHRNKLTSDLFSFCNQTLSQLQVFIRKEYSCSPSWRPCSAVCVNSVFSRSHGEINGCFPGTRNVVTKEKGLCLSVQLFLLCRKPGIIWASAKHIPGPCYKRLLVPCATNMVRMRIPSCI